MTEMDTLLDSFLGTLKHRHSDGKRYNALIAYKVKLWAI